MPSKFRDPEKQKTYEAARAMHDILSVEGSGRGMAYRRGWNGHPYQMSWSSWPFYAAGRNNRRALGGDDLPPVS